MSYQAFLDRKRRSTQATGIDVDPAELHPMLHGFQRDGAVWAIKTGRAAMFWDCGMGKTFAQLEWARLSGSRSLIVAPLSVARQTVREARSIDLDVHYVRDGSDVDGDGIWATNYELIDRFNPADFDAVVLDESSILKSIDGKMRTRLIETFSAIPRRLACTATPAPNDVSELTNHAEFLGVMRRVEMLAAYFVHDERDWRLKGHAVEPMFRWMAGWAMALRRPSDCGYDDEGFDLPPLTIRAESVAIDAVPDGQLFATDLGGIGGRAAVRKQTLSGRVERTAELVAGDDQWIIWCGLNAEADGIERLVDGAVNVPGSWSPDAKAAALEGFQDGEIRVLVTKPSIAGFGMNFQNCSRMAFVGLSDSYESYYQAIRRCWRFGQTEPVDVRIVVSELERQIVDNVRRKEREAAQMTEALVRQMGAIR